MEVKMKLSFEKAIRVHRWTFLLEGGRCLLGVLKFCCVWLVSCTEISDLLNINVWTGEDLSGGVSHSNKLLKQTLAFKIGHRKWNSGWWRTAGLSNNQYETTRVTVWDTVFPTNDSLLKILGYIILFLVGCFLFNHFFPLSSSALF